MKKYRVLVIEDEVSLGESLSFIMEFYDLQPVIAGNGKSGLDILRSEIIHFVVCDINLPDISGYTVLEEVRKDPSLQQIPFVFLSAYGDDNDRKKGLDLGADDYLVKPFASKQLIKTIHTRLYQ